MKYNDKQSIKWRQKQDERSDTKSDRTKRRELERQFVKFGIKVCKYVESDWWDCLEFSDKNNLYNGWLNLSMNPNMRYKDPDFIESEFIKWIKSKRIEIKPNMALYRDKKLNKILK